MSCHARPGEQIHDVVSNYLARSVEWCKYSIRHGPVLCDVFKQKKLKHNLITYNTNNILVINSLILHGQFPVSTYHNSKVTKYDVLEPQLQQLRPNRIFFTSLRYNWCGIKPEELANFLFNFKILRFNNFKIIATRILFWIQRFW